MFINLECNDVCKNKDTRSMNENRWTEHALITNERRWSRDFALHGRIFAYD